MSDLVDRYVNEVGRNLAKKDRADIEAELRSMIYDRLEDRYGGTETDTDVALILKELGDPRKLAGSYLPIRYLIGPEAFPYLVTTLRNVWVTIPTIVIFLHIFGALTATQPAPVGNMLLEMLATACYATFIGTALVIIGFAAIERILKATATEAAAFDPSALPPVDDPRSVDRLEATFGVVLGIVFGLMFLYFLSIGGLTLRFGTSNPEDLIPVPLGWLAALIAAMAGMIVVQALVLRTNQWTAALWLAQTVLELFGTTSLYFVVYEPITQRLAERVPSLNGSNLLENVPEILVVMTVVFAVAGRSRRLLRLWKYREPFILPVVVSANR